MSEQCKSCEGTGLVECDKCGTEEALGCLECDGTGEVDKEDE